MGQAESKEIICISINVHGGIIPYKSDRTTDIGPENRSDLAKFINVRSSNKLSIYKLSIAPPGTCGMNTGFITDSFNEYLGRTPCFSFADLQEESLKILDKNRGKNERARATIRSNETVMTDVNPDFFAWEPFNYNSRMVKNIFMDKVFDVDSNPFKNLYSITILNGKFKGANILDLRFLISRGITRDFLIELYGGSVPRVYNVEGRELLSEISFSQLVILVNALNLSDKLFFLDNSCSVLPGQKLDLNRHNQNLPLKSFFESGNNLKDLLVTDEQVEVVNLGPMVVDPNYSTRTMIESQPTVIESTENHRIFNTKYCANEEEVEGGRGKRKSKKLRSKKLRSKKLRSKKLRSKKLRSKKQ
jgi:hypothetical protein